MKPENQNSARIRSLEPDEWHLLPRVTDETRSDEPEPRKDQTIVVVAEMDSRIIGTITAERSWCVSNFWVDESIRGAGVARLLAETIAAQNTEGLREILATTSRHVELLAYNMKFIPIQGTLWRR
jgi:GNAT superfamily N-acetyltransferase